MPPAAPRHEEQVSSNLILTGLVSRCIVLCMVPLAILLSWTWAASAWKFTRPLENGDTESNLLLMPSEENIPVLIMGTSHGRVFSRFGNHPLVENLLSRKVLNLSRGGGGGVVPALMDLELFYDRGNEASLLLYFLDPWVLFSPTWNEDNFANNPLFYKVEPFSFDYFARLFHHGGVSAASRYLQARLHFDWNWFFEEPLLEKKESSDPLRAAPERLQKRLSRLYLDGLQHWHFEKYKDKFTTLVDLAQEHGTRVVVVMPPTMFGKEPGHADTVQYLQDLCRTRKLAFCDYSNLIRDPNLFSDTDHLNKDGIHMFTKKYLQPIVLDNRHLTMGSNLSKSKEKFSPK